MSVHGLSPGHTVLQSNGELSDLLLDIKVPRENTRGARG
mgnify:FL=1|jgi:hypothetical protein